VIKRLNRFAATAAGVVVAFGFSTAALAGPVNIQADMGNSTEGLGDFIGTVEYTFTGGTTGTLVIELTNTSNAANGGFLTAFVFNINSSDGSASATLSSSTNASFLNITGGGLNAPPFGTYEAGAGLNGTFLGGGNPSGGIAVGETDTFTFDIVATDAATLETLDFLTGSSDFDFVARFRGFEDGGSDKVPGVPTTVIPLPAPIVLAGIGLPIAGLMSWRARRKANAS
jgi:hypothetical protein